MDMSVDPAPTLVVAPACTIALFCWVVNVSESPFSIKIDSSLTVDELKKAIVNEKPHTFSSVDADELHLYKTDVVLATRESLTSLRVREGEDERLEEWRDISNYWPSQPLKSKVHMLVLCPDGPHASKKPRLHQTDPITPPRQTQAQAQDSPPRLTTKAQVEGCMETAFKPFEEYMDFLAEGKLDGYLNSINPEDKAILPGIMMSTKINLLLHQLGEHVDKTRIEELFDCGTVHLFNTSGSGKTCLSLGGLCHKWGFYFSCRRKGDPKTGGSLDVDVAISEVLPTLSTWDGGNHRRLADNASAADRVILMLVCVRVFILKQLVRRTPMSTKPFDIRRRWVLLQALPPAFFFNLADDIFVSLLRSLRAGDSQVMKDFSVTTVMGMMEERRDLFPNNELFAILDEAQDATKCHIDCFPATTNPSVTRSALHELFRVIRGTQIFCGIILSGTGLSMDVVKTSVNSMSARLADPNSSVKVFTDTGNFLDKKSQKDYILRYLKLSNSDPADCRLLERIQTWFIGRHRLTASLIELLLDSKDSPRHRILTKFFMRLTGFTITDATDLEDEEKPIPKEIEKKMDSYLLLSSVKNLFNARPFSPLVGILIRALKRWVIEGQPSCIPIEGNMHEMISLGVGLLEIIKPIVTFESNLNYPVQIVEPAVILSLSTLFESQPATQRQTWIANTWVDAPNSSVHGYAFEYLVMLVLMEQFGGKPIPLGNVFNFKQSELSLAARKATLVALRREDGSTFQSCKTSFTSGASDRFGYRAKSPADVLKFFQDPEGYPFLFPDNNMGPDLVGFLQDDETGELITLLAQDKVTPDLTRSTWLGAVNSTHPNLFYTMIKDGSRQQYAPVTYPGVADDIREILKTMLGEKVYVPVADAYREKLRSSTLANEESKLHEKRQTPKYLRIIATPRDEQQSRLGAEAQGDVVTLKWEVVSQYIGSVADAAVTDT